MAHVTRGMWHMDGGEHSLKILTPLLLRIGKDSFLTIGRKRITYWLNEWMTKVFVEDLPASPGLLNTDM